MANATPAIAGHYDDEDRDVTVLTTSYSNVNFCPGLGESGHKIQIVEHECPQCEHPTMLREYRVNPETRDRVGYFCNNPACRYYHCNEFRYGFCHGPTDGPKIERYDQ